MAQSLANFVALLRKMFARERLPELPAEAPPRRPSPGLFRLILGPESLPEDPVPEAPSRRPGGSVFGREELPEDPVLPGPGADRGLLSLLLGSEPLPEDPPGPPRRRSRWAAWLFAPERIDPS